MHPGAGMYLAVGNQLLVSEQYRAAIEYYDKALQYDSYFADIWFNKGKCLTKLGRWPEVLICFEKTRELEGASSELLRIIGDVRSEIGQFREAHDCYEEARSLSPKDYKIYHSEGVTYQKEGKKAEALQCFEKALSFCGSVATLWNSLGFALAELGRHDEAIETYDKALAIKETEPSVSRGLVLLNKSNSLYSLNRMDEALNVLDTATKWNPKYADAWCNKAVFLCNTRRFKEGLHAADKVLEIDPEYEKAKQIRISCLHILGRLGS